MNSLRNDILAGLHYVAQLHTDRLIAYMASDDYIYSTVVDRYRVAQCVLEVTHALGGFTKAVLQVWGQDVQSFLPVLFKELDALDAMCRELGISSVDYDHYRKLLESTL